MSADKVDTIVKVDVVRCDICGEIIPPEVVEDPEQHGMVLGYDRSLESPTPETKLVKFRWPGNKARKRLQDEREKAGDKGPHGLFAGEMADRNWDFHGLCLVRLVDAAINLRTNPPEVIEVPEVTRDEMLEVALADTRKGQVLTREGITNAVDLLRDAYRFTEQPEV